MIPLSVPNIEGNEWKYVKECLDSGWISSAGSYVNKFENLIAKYVGARYGVACMNGTVGLYISQKVIGIQSDNYVIAPNLTFVATLNSIKYTGARPILIDICPETWQMDLDLLENFLENNTTLKVKNNITISVLKSDGKKIGAIMPVHVLGNMLDIQRLIFISKKYHIPIVEDSTESLGTFYKTKHSGTFGTLGVFSFNGNKIISTGGGGVIVTNDKELAIKAKHLSNQAKVQGSLEYFHDEIGYNFRLVNVLAAIGYAQMERFPEILDKKKYIDSFYRSKLNEVGDVIFQKVHKNVNHNCWLFTIQTKRMRELLNFLNNNKVESRPFWVPMNELPMYSREIYVTKNNICRNIYSNAISIPSSSSISEDQLNTVVNTIKEFYK